MAIRGEYIQRQPSGSKLFYCAYLCFGEIVEWLRTIPKTVAEQTSRRSNFRDLLASTSQAQCTQLQLRLWRLDLLHFLLSEGSKSYDWLRLCRKGRWLCEKEGSMYSLILKEATTKLPLLEDYWRVKNPKCSQINLYRRIKICQEQVRVPTRTYIKMRLGLHLNFIQREIAAVIFE